MNLVEIKDFGFSYPESSRKVLEHVNLNIKEGTLNVIMGRSGCGKSTLLRQLKSVLAPAGEKEGEILYRNIPLRDTDHRTQSQEIGFVMQNPDNQIVTDKVWHELAFGLESLGYDNATIRLRVAEMASYFGIQKWFYKNVSELSGGQKQLLNLASVMAMHPSLLILDEPTSQLDPIAASDFIGTLAKLNRELGTTILMVEHRLEEVFPIADKVGVMERGELFLWDSPRSVGKELGRIPKGHRMMVGMPSAVRIYHSLEVPEAQCPLTVREGREFLEANFTNQVRQVKDVPQIDRNSRETVLSLKNVWFRYERDTPDILEGVALEIKKGEIVSILGGNGSGKTTLLSVVAGLNRPYRGRIRIFGRKRKAYRGNELYRNTLGLLPQNPQSVFLKESVREDYRELQKVMNYSDQQMGEQIGKVAGLLEIENLLDKHPYDLSGGEQQKAALGKILLLQPRLLLLDEPTKGIDAYSKYNLMELMRKLQDEGITILMVTHDVEFAASVSSRCAMFFDRELTSVDSPVEFFGDNSFYTTAANRIARNLYGGVVTCEDVVEMCVENGRRQL